MMLSLRKVFRKREREPANPRASAVKPPNLLAISYDGAHTVTLNGRPVVLGKMILWDLTQHEAKKSLLACACMLHYHDREEA